jgi:GNAT superfamily N-acetyltransferase
MDLAAMDLAVVSLAVRPDLAPALNQLATSWPRFMLEDPAAWMMRLLRDHPRFQLALLAGGRLVAKAYSVPFAWDGDETSLPDTGWDTVLATGVMGAVRSREPTAVSALEISIDPDWQGKGLSRVLVDALRSAAAQAGYADLVAPVRPSRKSDHPHVPMAEYVTWQREDGLPYDPWLRVHVRAGGRIVKVCPASMVIPGSLAQWRTWTGLPFNRSGPVDVPGALTPVHVSVEHDHAVYVEPNVWVRHGTEAGHGS